MNLWFENLKNKFKEKFDIQKYRLQIIGAVLLIPAFIIAIIAARMNSETIAFWWGWGILTPVGIIDLVIKYQAKRQGIPAIMITRWIRDLLPKGIDNIAMFGFIGLVWWLTGALFALFYMHGFLNDHFNEARK
jgi:hypothetical protein